MESMFGTSAPTPPRLVGRNLQCKQEHTMEKYIDLHEEKNRNHKMDCKLSWIESALDMVEREDSDAPTLDCIDAFNNKLDAEHVEIERFSETNCRKKKDGKFPYFPEMNQWWQKRCVYYRLLKYFRGDGVKLKGLRQECERHEIPQPSEITIEMVQEGITRCSDELDKLRPVAYPKRKEHLTLLRRQARLEEKDKNVRAIERIMLREDTLNTWGRLKIATRRP